MTLVPSHAHGLQKLLFYFPTKKKQKGKQVQAKHGNFSYEFENVFYVEGTLGRPSKLEHQRHSDGQTKTVSSVGSLSLTREPSIMRIND